MHRRRLALALAILVFAASGALQADSRIAFKPTEGKGPHFQGMLIGHGKVRNDADTTKSVILDPASQTLIVLDHRTKQFTRLTRADVDQLIKNVDEAARQMEQAMPADMPAAMRDRMKSMMAGNGMVIENVVTGQKNMVAGHACTIFQMKIAGRVASEMCMAEPSAIELPAEDRATLEATGAWFKDFAGRLNKLPIARLGQGIPANAGLVPLRSTEIAQDGTRATSEFSSISTAAIPAEMFAVPADYKEQKIQLPKIGRGGF